MKRFLKYSGVVLIIVAGWGLVVASFFGDQIKQAYDSYFPPPTSQPAYVEKEFLIGEGLRPLIPLEDEIIGPPSPVPDKPCSKLRTQVFDPTVKIIVKKDVAVLTLQPTSQTFFDVYEKIVPSSLGGVKYEVHACGTGFVVKRDERGSVVATAAHAVRGATVVGVISYEWEDGKTIEKAHAASVITVFAPEAGEDADRSDVALLRVPNLFTVEPVKLAECGAEWGEPLLGSHCSLSKPPILTTGLVSQLPEDEGGKGFLRCSVPIYPGASGGPLFVRRDSDYQVVGVIAAGARSDHPDVNKWAIFMTFVVGVEKVHEIMKSCP